MKTVLLNRSRNRAIIDIGHQYCLCRCFQVPTHKDEGQISRWFPVAASNVSLRSRVNNILCASDFFRGRPSSTIPLKFSHESEQRRAAMTLTLRRRWTLTSSRPRHVDDALLRAVRNLLRENHAKSRRPADSSQHGSSNPVKRWIEIKMKKRKKKRRKLESINRCHRDYLWLGKIGIRSAYALTMALAFFMRVRCCDSKHAT